MTNKRDTMICFILLIFMVGCVGDINNSTVEETIVTDTARHDDPDYLFSNNPDIDMIVYGLSAYVNASDVEWVAELNLEKMDEIGSIQDVYTIDTELLLTATLIPKGSIVYESRRYDIILVEVDDLLVPYLKWIEG